MITGSHRDKLGWQSEHKSCIRNFKGYECVWCNKPFNDGTSSRSTATAIRVTIRLNTKSVKVHGWACSICVTRLANSQQATQDGVFQQVQESMDIPFLPKEDWSAVIVQKA